MSNIHLKLLNWYNAHHRLLPWRVTPEDCRLGMIPDPYHIWLSEIMLQQTTVGAVKPYFETFIALWPTLEDLADTSPDNVMRAWAGLGYYSRARNLKKCADLIADKYHGKFPETEAELLTLPGIGSYTAAAITAIAFNKPANVVDGNIERIFTRLFTIKTPIPKAKKEIKARFSEHISKDHPGDFVQGLMDLGASICTPKKPDCLSCPLQDECGASAIGRVEFYPVKLPKKTKPFRKGAAFVIEDQTGAILLCKRPDKGLLAAMSEVPNTDWNANKDGATNKTAAPIKLNWHEKGDIHHVFTHFELTLTVYHAQTTIRPMLNGWWSPPDKISTEALPNLMKKVINAAKPDVFKQ